MEKVIDSYSTRATTRKPHQNMNNYFTDNEPWNAGIGKKCPFCGIEIQRDDLMVVEKIAVGEKKQREYDYLARGMTRDAAEEASSGVGLLDLKREKRKYPITDDIKVKDIRWKYWHRPCYYASRGERDWYRPGILAEDIDEEENPMRNPIVKTGKLLQKSSKPKNALIVKEKKRKPTFFETPQGLAVLGGVGVVGFGVYYFLIRKKYGIGDILKNLTEVGITHQVIDVKFVGFTRKYVLRKNTDQSVSEIPVRELDADPNWIKVA